LEEPAFPRQGLTKWPQIASTEVEREGKGEQASKESNAGKQGEDGVGVHPKECVPCQSLRCTVGWWPAWPGRSRRSRSRGPEGSQAPVSYGGHHRERRDSGFGSLL
jgi:hypothetical protein